MATVRISDSRFLARKRTPRLLRHLFIRRDDAPYIRGSAALAVRVAFALLLGALLYSIASSVSLADVLPTARPLQSLASIRAAAEDHVKASSSRTNAAANEPNTSSIVVTATELDTRLQLKQCGEPLSAFTLNAAPIAARTTIGVRCSASNPAHSGNPDNNESSSKTTGVEWTVYVPVVVESEIDVLVLRNSMPRDAHVAAGDLSTERRRVPGFGSSYISNIALLRDQHLKRGVPAGTALMADMLMRDLVVKRGQQVQLVFNVGGLAVHATGLAMADGGTADRIRVQNQSSLKVVEGVIESGNLVRVGM